ncbi:MAG: hypothetical protein EB107_11575, partial [Proteobacteria bacterium]|nr:hypothetical protein [Pseudomonadota bacterium]
DVAITGRLGPSALAGSGVSLQIMFIAFSALSAFGIGTTVVVAQATGARTPAVAGNALRQGMVLGTIFSLLLTCVGWLITEPLIALAGGTGDVAEAGVTFLTVGLVGMVPLTLQFAIGGAMRGAGDSRTPMICGALVNVVNIAAAYALAFGAWGAPEMGVAGAERQCVGRCNVHDIHQGTANHRGADGVVPVEMSGVVGSVVARTQILLGN